MLANVGVPMIFIHWPLMFCALVPVIILEALLIRRWLPLSLRDAFMGVAKANIVSTLVGVPLAWLAMLALEFAVMLPFGLAAEHWKWKLDGPVWRVLEFLFSVAWIAPAEDYLHWMVPTAIALLLLPCLYLSLIFERRSCRRSWPAADPAQVRRAVFAVNLASYAFLFMLACGWATFELATKGPRVDRFGAEPGGAAPRSQPVSPDTNRASLPAGSGGLPVR